MNQKLHILNLEDSETDSELIQARLEEEGIACELTRVETERDFVSALEEGSFDLLLVDYRLPSFDGMSALAIARDISPDVPFIFVSGSIGEDKAIESLKNGATDYVLKDKLSRLAPAIRRALKESGERIERKRTEEALLESGEFNRQIIESVQEGIIVYGLDLRYRIWNHFMERLTGLPASEVLGRHPLELFPFLRETGVITAIEKALTGETGEAGQFRFHIPQRGISGWASDLSAPLRNARGEIIGVIGTIRDITAHVQSEEGILSAAREWTASFDAMSDGVSIHGLDHAILNTNESLRQLLGKTADEITGKKCYQIFHEKDCPVADCPLQRTKETNQPATLEIFEPAINKWLAISTSPVFDDSGCIVKIVHTVRDITEHKKLEDQLRHSQKMEAVGTLAGGVAHDFNNILNVIIGYGTMLRDRLENDPLTKEQLNEVLAAADRAANLTKRLLTFSRRQIVEVKPVNVNELIIGMEKMLGRIVSEDIAFVLELTSRKIIVLADPGQIEQVLMNLVSNARYAMQNGGKLTISTGIKELDEEFIAAYGYGKRGTYALISVTDTGSGMDVKTQQKIFEPFFTTKGVGEGTGLGLSIVYGIIKQHDGYIKVYSEAGNGTTFKIYLPIVQMQGDEQKNEPIATYPAGGTETILVAEDDAALRKLIESVLKEFGYTVILATDGAEAVEQFKANRGGIHLCILDLIMPRMNGKEAYIEITKMKPGMKVLFSSGYTSDIIDKKGVRNEGLDFIMKPVSPMDLLRKAREILDRRCPEGDY